ncbi:hypothetical protein COM81_27790 [Priestia megaterium]|uniref:GIY-YIG nuclease family protein n=1 Tax=Priestia megaterium TaxID=1404 RepID=UPI000BEBE045|nr:GIY-YIG nuclease family protein [Priestia megaterium]PEE73594.1 hypothetical protein COM81_27790 [Priestia megaterium]
MNNDVIALLEKRKYYPISSPLWKSFKFKQIKSLEKQDFKKNMKFLKSNVGAEKGIYVYVNDAEEVLYVGKGNPIKDRLISHYKKLHLNNTKNNKRVAFFQTNQGIVTIYWLGIEKEEEREIVEHLLTYILKPKYKNKWRCI